jgi:hypothetical protein
VPTLVLEIHASARLLHAWGLWISCLCLALLFGTGLPWWLRGLAAAVLWPLWRGGRRALGAGTSPRRLAIRGDGQWLWQAPPGAVRYVRLAGTPQHLGPLWWLPLAGEHATTWMLIDAGVMEPASFSALQSCLQLRNRRTGPEFGDAS